MIRAIDLSSISEIDDYRIPRNDRMLYDIGKVNLFIGQNNSGKSRFLRRLASSSGLRFCREEEFHKKMESTVGRLDDIVKRILPGNLISFGTFSRTTFQRDINYQWLTLGEESGSEKLIRILEQLKEANFKDVRYEGAIRNPPNVVEGWNAQLKGLYDSFKLEFFPLEKYPKESGHRIFVPVMRGFRTLSETEDFFETRNKKDYGFPDEKIKELKIFTGQKFYRDLTNLLLGSKEQRKQVSDYEEFLSIEFFESREVELIPKVGANTIVVNVGGEERPIYELGDGYQAIIALTFAPFIEAPRSLVFVEEPEIYLHPGWQRRLLELYLRHPRLSSHQYFLATHSNHFLDLSMEDDEISTFLFRRKQEEKITNIIHTSVGDKVLLSELGARSSSVFLTNKTIWVEGITDRLYIQALLEKYQKSKFGKQKFRVDTHYTIAELGGSNMVHWDFSDFDQRFGEMIRVSRLCAESFVLIDGDNRQKGNRVDALTEALGTDFMILKGKEIENLLPLEIVKKAATEVLGRSLRPIDISKLAEGDYLSKDCGIGAALDAASGVPYFSSGVQGGILQKLEFCKKCVDLIRTESSPQLTGEALDVAETIFNFIER